MSNSTFDVVHIKRESQHTNADIVIDHVGRIWHSPGSHTMMDFRDHHILHYVVEGKGTFTCEGKSYSLNAGDVYLFPKNTKVSYQADSRNPWSLFYVGFFGVHDDEYVRMLGLSAENIAIYNIHSDTIPAYYQNMLAAAHAEGTMMTTLVGWFYLIIGELLKCGNIHEKPVEPIDLFHEVVNFMETNISQPVRIAKIASMFHISQSQLYRIFMQACKQSPQQFYEKIRINHACTLIYQSNLTYKEISRLCGYDYESHFYKSFMKLMGITPAEYRKQRIAAFDE